MDKEWSNQIFGASFTSIRAFNAGLFLSGMPSSAVRSGGRRLESVRRNLQADAAPFTRICHPAVLPTNLAKLGAIGPLTILRFLGNPGLHCPNSVPISPLCVIGNGDARESSMLRNRGTCSRVAMGLHTLKSLLRRRECADWSIGKFGNVTFSWSRKEVKCNRKQLAKNCLG